MWRTTLIAAALLLQGCLPDGTTGADTAAAGADRDAGATADGAAADGATDDAALDDSSARPDAAALLPGHALPDRLTLLARAQCRRVWLLGDEVVCAWSEAIAVASVEVEDGAARVCAQAAGQAELVLLGRTTQAKSTVDVQLAPGPFGVAVAEVAYGEGAGFGQEQMPDIVLGPPEGAGERAGSLDVVSLGAEGAIVLELGLDVVDGPGPDLLVFENAFEGWLEPGRVSVSADGVDFVDFPCAPDEPFAGCAGLQPVLSSTESGLDPTDPQLAGGDAFDLAEIGVARARYVQVQSLGGSDLGGASLGFDLDAMAAIHTAPQGAGALEAPAALALVVGGCAPVRADLVTASARHCGVRVSCSLDAPELAELAQDCQAVCGLATGTTSVQLTLGELSATVEVVIEQG